MWNDFVTQDALLSSAQCLFKLRNLFEYLWHTAMYRTEVVVWSCIQLLLRIDPVLLE